MHVFTTKLEPFGRGWVNFESIDREMRAASGFNLWAKETKNLAIDPNRGLCLAHMKHDGATGCINTNPVYCNADEIDRLAKEHPEDAEDLMMDSFVAIALKKSWTAKGSSFKTWLFAIGRKLALKHNRKKRRE
ncbi:MAG: hypothetical protein IJT32_04020, partial [Lachnospiraceae bacterium]|nr:hypothetical protein [Lachnospiraceae bacterium]